MIFYKSLIKEAPMEPTLNNTFVYKHAAPTEPCFYY
jgi:hypothetical protein